MDPFELHEERIAPQSGVKIDWQRLAPGEAQICKQIGDRCAMLIAQVAMRSKTPMWQPSGTWCGADIACAHMERPLDLARLLRATDLELTAFYVQIARTIDRLTGRVHGMHAPDVARFHKGI